MAHATFAAERRKAPVANYTSALKDLADGACRPSNAGDRRSPVTETAHHDGNIALLIDADNASPDHIDAVLTVLAELGTVNIRRAYGNWSKPGLKGWSSIIHRYGIEPQQQFDITKGKNATDMKMT